MSVNPYLNLGTQIKFTKNSAEAFIQAYFAGCFRVLSLLQINRFHFDSVQALRISSFFVNSPTLEKIDLSNNQLKYRTVKAILDKLHKNKALKVIDISSNYVYSDQILELQKEYDQNKSNEGVHIIFG
jgi:hypothetical protein